MFDKGHRRSNEPSAVAIAGEMCGKTCASESRLFFLLLLVECKSGPSIFSQSCGSTKPINFRHSSLQFCFEKITSAIGFIYVVKDNYRLVYVRKSDSKRNAQHLTKCFPNSQGISLLVFVKFSPKETKNNFKYNLSALVA